MSRWVHPQFTAGFAGTILAAEGRDGGSLADRAQRVFAWNTGPKNLESHAEKWNEFPAA